MQFIQRADTHSAWYRRVLCHAVLYGCGMNFFKIFFKDPVLGKESVSVFTKHVLSIGVFLYIIL